MYEIVEFINARALNIELSYIEVRIVQPVQLHYDIFHRHEQNRNFYSRSKIFAERAAAKHFHSQAH